MEESKLFPPTKKKKNRKQSGIYEKTTFLWVVEKGVIWSSFHLGLKRLFPLSLAPTAAL